MPELQPVTTAPPLHLKQVFEDYLAHARRPQAVFLTYSFDLPFFEAYLLPILIRGGCSAISVLADGRWLAERLPGWIESREIREAGRQYTLSGVRVPGAFHPKLVLMADETTGTLLVGSGNISAYGMATGGELFTYETWQEGRISPRAKQAWQICRQLAQALPIDPVFGERLEVMGHTTPMGVARVSDGDLLHNLREPLLAQLEQHVRGRPVREIVLWAPFTDRHLTALTHIVERLAPEQVTLVLQPGVTSIDGTRLAQIAGAYGGIRWKLAELVVNSGLLASHNQLVHGKGILVHLGSNDEILLAGSPNLSAPALLQTASSGNFELARLVVGRGLRSQLFAKGGPVALGGPVDPTSLHWVAEPDAGPSAAESAVAELLGAHWDGEVLKLVVAGSCPQPASIVLDNEQTFPVRLRDGAPCVALPPGTSVIGVTLVWNSGRSGPVIVTDLPRLATMFRGTEVLRHTPLEALDYGGDDDLIALLDELAQLAIITTDDISRAIHGRPPATPAEEAREADGQVSRVVDLADINFDALAQHPRSRAYRSGGESSFDAPRIQLWLDEIVRQFDMLRAEQELRLVKPLATADNEEDSSETETTLVHMRRRWAVSRRIRVRVRNRVRRYIRGLSDDRFWKLVGPEWMAKNYVLFLHLLHRLWARTVDPQTTILQPDDLAELSLDLFEAFWGSDENPGYWSRLSDDEVTGAGLILLDYQGDALTITTAARLVARQDEACQTVPFVVAGFVRAAESLGLLTVDAAERALLLLDQLDADPTGLLHDIRACTSYFTWERYGYILAKRFNLRSVTVRRDLFTTGETLVIQAGLPLDEHPAPLAVLADWIGVETRRRPGRRIFQVVWNTLDEVLIYDAADQELIRRRKDSSDNVYMELLAAGSMPSDFASWGELPRLRGGMHARVG